MIKWIKAGSVEVSDDGFVILIIGENEQTTLHMPCVGGHIAQLATYTSIDAAHKGAECMCSDEVAQHYGLVDDNSMLY